MIRPRNTAALETKFRFVIGRGDAREIDEEEEDIQLPTFAVFTGH